MPRSTLKLPAKTSTSGTTGETKSPFRKPIRGAAKAVKQSAAQHAQAIAVKALRQAASAEKRPIARTQPKPPSAPAEPAAVINQGSAQNAPTTPRPASPANTPKSYPKRGIARSTGARALPPMRKPDERSARPDPAQTPSAGAPAPNHEAAELPRLSKRICELAQCSRREADEWIENGWVSVDGLVVTTLGTRARPDARIEINEGAHKHERENITILLNKPLEASPSKAEQPMIRPENRWSEEQSKRTFKATHLRGLTQVGKLDAESTGMLVFTQEGSVVRRIAEDETRLEKEYMVRVEGELSPAGLKKLHFGLTLDETELKRAQVSWQNEQQLRFVLHENKRNQIRRMCELVGLHVISVKLIRIGSVSLGKLPVGKWRYLREDERF